jgi:hypothetical protein
MDVWNCSDHAGKVRDFSLITGYALVHLEALTLYSVK